MAAKFEDDKTNVQKPSGMHQNAVLENRLEAIERQLHDILKLVRGNDKPKSPISERSTRPLRPKKNRLPSANDMSTLLHLQEALRDNVQQFTDNLDLQSDKEILDILFERGCINDDEYAAITARHTPKDKVRLLIVKLRSRASHLIQMFLDVLKEKCYTHLVKKVEASLEKIVKNEKRKARCVICVMKATVDIKDIADHLWSSSVIPGHIYDSVVVSDNPQQYRGMFWEHIIHSMDDPECCNDELGVLIQALEQSNYHHITEFIKELPKGSHLSCCCLRSRLRRQRTRESLGSTSDVSTTSEIPRSNGDSMLSYASEFHENGDGVELRRKRSKRVDRRRRINETKELMQKQSISDIVKEGRTLETVEENSSSPLYSPSDSSENHLDPFSITRDDNSWIEKGATIRQDTGGEASDLTFVKMFCDEPAEQPNCTNDDTRSTTISNTDVHLSQNVVTVDVDETGLKTVIPKQTMFKFEESQGHKRQNHETEPKVVYARNLEVCVMSSTDGSASCPMVVQEQESTSFNNKPIRVVETVNIQPTENYFGYDYPDSKTNKAQARRSNPITKHTEHTDIQTAYRTILNVSATWKSQRPTLQYSKPNISRCSKSAATDSSDNITQEKSNGRLEEMEDISNNRPVTLETVNDPEILDIPYIDESPKSKTTQHVWCMNI